MLSKFGLLVVSCCLFFTTGFALGQKQSHFALSQVPASVTEMDLNLIQANLNVLRNAYGYDKDGIGVPWIYFDKNTGTVKALASVDGDELEKKPLDVLRAELMNSVAGTRLIASTFIPELKTYPKVDIEMEFEGLATKRMTEAAIQRAKKQTGLEPYSFYAAYRNGKLTIGRTATDVP